MFAYQQKGALYRKQSALGYSEVKLQGYGVANAFMYYSYTAGIVALPPFYFTSLYNIAHLIDCRVCHAHHFFTMFGEPHSINNHKETP